MKNFVLYLVIGIAASIGFNAGEWLWDVVLKEKFDGLKKKLRK